MADFDSMVPDAQPQAAAPQGSFDSLVDDSQAQQQQYGNTGEQIKAGLEGVARGVAGPIASAIEKNYYRVPQEDIRGRQEANPITAGIGEGAGLLGGALTGTGEAAALEAIGKGATEATGLSNAASFVPKVGSSIVKNAAEMAAYQAGDETSKMILQDPDAGAQSAISNIGLAAALGGVGGGLISGVASPLWEATIGSKAGQGLKALVSRIGGIEGDEALGKAEGLAAKAGLEIPPEIQAVVDDQPTAREAHSILSQDDSSIAGRSYQKKLQDLDNQMGIKTAESLGKTPEDIANVPEKNNYEAGQNLGNTLHDELKPTIDNISKQYDSITEEFKQKPTWQVQRSMADELAQKSIQEGWTKSFDDANHKLIQNILEKLPEQNTINDLKLAISNLYRPYDAPDFKAAIEAKKILSKGLENAVTQHMGPEELAGYNQLRQQYSQLSDHLENLDGHLHLGKWSGPKSFLEALKEKANQKGENLLFNMTGKNNAALLDLLQNHPQTLESVANHYKDSIIRSATRNVNPGELIKTGKLLKEIEGLSPQQKALIASPEQHSKIEAIHALKESLFDPNHNFSNTARTLHKHAAGAVTPLSLIAMMMGRGEAGILSYIGGLGFNEARPGMKLAIMKMLGSSKPVDAAGFAAASQYFNAAQKGAKVLSTASENVFKPGLRVLSATQIPSAMDIQKLDKLVASNDPKHNEMLAQNSANGRVGHYLPEHQTALTASSMGAVQYLRGIRPQNQPLAPLEAVHTTSPIHDARYQRALEIAQQPAMVLQHIKRGELQPTDVQDMNAMYPALYKQLSQKLSNEMINAKADGTQISYKTRMGISLFLGQPMDASMQPTSIQAAQGVFAKPAQGPQQQAQKMGKKGTSTLGKSNNSYKTQSQSAESDRAGRE